MADGKKNEGTARIVWKMALPYAEKLGLSIWDVRYVREGGSYFLRIFIDKPGGVGIEDCEAMSRAINTPLDELDPIRESYCLEVSSPGINRELARPEHYAACAGKRVAVRLIRPLPGGEREISGSLAGFDSGIISLRNDSGETLEIAQKDAAWVRLADDEELEESEET